VDEGGKVFSRSFPRSELCSREPSAAETATTRSADHGRE
jgi:hypothetical protein